jgi:hypothetical protein
MGVRWNGKRPADFRKWEEAIAKEVGEPVSVTLDEAGGGEWMVSWALVGWTSIRREAREVLRDAGLPVVG